VSIQVNDVVRLGNYSGATASDGTSAAAFATILGVATNPTAVTLRIDKPDGDRLVYGWPSAGLDGTLTNESAGRFYADITIDMGGLWTFDLIGTGAVAASTQGTFRVDRQRVIVE
jgi:hypothetical protein